MPVIRRYDCEQHECK